VAIPENLDADRNLKTHQFGECIMNLPATSRLFDNCHPDPPQAEGIQG
jgi:hypothetical protein